MAVFSYHAWFVKEPIDEEGIPGISVPKKSRLKWLKKMQLGKVRFLFVGSLESTTRVIKVADLPAVNEVVGGATGSKDQEDQDSDDDEDNPHEPKTMDMVSSAARST